MNMQEEKQVRKLRIKNFKALEDVEIEFKKFTLLLGPNGSGKSSVLKAIKFLGTNLNKPDSFTKYITKDGEDLGSFEEIVHNNNSNNKIVFEYNETQLIKESILDEQNKYEPFQLKIEIDENINSENLSLLEISDPRDNSIVSIYPNKERDVRIIDHCIENVRRSNVDPDSLKNLLEMYYERGVSSEEDSLNDIFNDKKSFYDTIGKQIDKHRNPNYEYGEIPMFSEFPRYSIFVDRNMKLFNNSELNNTFDKLAHYMDLLPFYDDLESIDNSFFSEFMLDDEYFKHIRELENKFNYFYNTVPKRVNKVFNSYYFTAIRQIPKRYYTLKNSLFDDNDYYGLFNKLYDKNPMGEYLRSLGAWHGDDFLIQVLKSFDFAESLEVVRKGRTGYLQLTDKSGVKYNLADASSGLIQLFPIIASTVIVNNHVIIIEQPELHLHPNLQAKLIEYFAKSHNDYLLETHSEHMIRKLQVMIAKGELNKDDVAIYFFEKDNATSTSKIKLIEIDDSGFLKEPFPDGFFDTSYNLSKELIFASKN